MNVGLNKQVFEEFQRAIDRAFSLATKLAPEHFHLAYDRCTKLQKAVFKRACGYCMPLDTSDEPESSESMKVTPFNVCYMNLPTLSLCAPLLSIIPPQVNSNTSKVKSENSDSSQEIFLEKLVLLKYNKDNVPSAEQIDELERDGHILKKCIMPLSNTIEEMTQFLIKYFQDSTETGSYELCLPHTDNGNLLRLLQSSDLPLSRNVTLFLRPIKGSVTSTLSPLSLSSQSEPSPDPSTLNSFIMDSHQTESVCHERSGTILSDSPFPPMEVDSKLSRKISGKSQRKYNWNVILAKLHEKLPESLGLEILPAPNKCHELHVIPPTSQKLRPTKRCQLCLKGYRSRKESRYFCGACGKGFHIKCFDVYHGQVGCVDFKVKIIDSDH